MSVRFDARGLPDPDDVTAPWDGDVPSYLTWWRALTAWQDAARVDPAAVWRVVVHGQRLLARYAHAVPSCEALRAVGDLGPLVEVGAGTGYWARLLRDGGADIVATDIDARGESTSWCSATRWTEVRQSDAATATATYADRSVFACWPARPGMSRILTDNAVGRPLALITWGLEDPFDGLLEQLNSAWELERTVALPTWFVRADELTIWMPK